MNHLNTLWLAGVGLLLHTAAQAQAPAKNSVRIGVDLLGLPQVPGGPRFQVQYGRHLASDRVVLAGSLGYFRATNERVLPGTTYMVTGRPIKRFTADITASFDFLRSGRHALRLGAGPSAWYCEDEKMGSGRYTLSSDGTVSNVNIEWLATEKINFGVNVLAEYEYALGERLTLGGRAGIASVQRQGGQTALLGLVAGYRF